MTFSASRVESPTIASSEEDYYTYAWASSPEAWCEGALLSWASPAVPAAGEAHDLILNNKFTNK